MFISIPQCVDNDNVVLYKWTIRSWIFHYVSLNAASHFQDKELQEIPCSQRYIMMAKIDCKGNIMGPTPDVADVLCPSSPFDAHETALWVRDLLRHIHRDVRYTNFKLTLLKLMHRTLYSITLTVLHPIIDSRKNGFPGPFQTIFSLNN